MDRSEIASGGSAMTHPVFISYARSTNNKSAAALHEALGASQGLSFLDSTDIEAGGHIPDAVFDALLGARVVVVLADEVYFTRRYCREEFESALTAFKAMVRSGAPEEKRAKALDPIVVAVPPSGARPREMERLPPLLAQTNWPAADDTTAVVALVHERLETVDETIGERLDALGLRQRLGPRLAELAIPPPRDLAGMRLFPVGGIPQSIGDAFVGRADELWAIHDALSTERGDTSGAALTGALEGGGGFGKTRLAAEYVHRFGPPAFPGGLFWLTAAVAEDRLEAQFHGILRTLRPDTPDLATFRSAERNAHEELGQALHSLATGEPVLYVVDNVPEPEPGQPPRPLSTWCPAIGEVALLVTSRARQSLIPGVRSLPVDVLSPDKAVLLLTGDYEEVGRLDEASWIRIAGWVGYLPLALELLNRVLRAGGLPPDELLSAIATMRPVEEVDRQMEALRGVVPEEALRGIAEAFMVSYDRLSAAEQRAARLLAQFSPNAIPEPLLDLFGPDEFPRAVRNILLARSFVTPMTSGPVRLFGRMHRVLADFLRVRAAEQEEEDRRLAYAALLKALDDPDDPSKGPLANACLPHAEWVLAPERWDGGLETALLLTQAALLLEHRAEFGRARDLLVPAIDLAGAANGPISPAVADRVRALGRVLQALGDMDGAFQKLSWALLLDQEALGPDDPAVADDLGALGHLLLEVGDLEGAKDHFERALRIDEASFGKDHLGVANDLANLGNVFMEIGDMQKAREYMERALGIEEAAYGKEDPRLAISLSNLGVVLLHLGDLPAAKENTERALAMDQALRGPTHPGVAKELVTLGSILSRFGDLPGAKSKFERALTIDEAVFGAGHPEVAIDLVNLAHVLNDMGDLEGARRRFEEAVRMGEATYGPDHPKVGARRTSLGLVLRDLGDLKGAARNFAVAVEIGEAAYGPDDPRVGQRLWYLGRTLQDMGYLKQARQRFERALAINEAAFGPNDSNVAKALNDIGRVLHDEGDLAGARARLERALAIEEAALGPARLDVAMVKNNLGGVLVSLGDIEGARAKFTEALEVFERELGRDHPLTETARRNIDSLS
jgi:tetratricopeptide (TPR) repeat protein